jgi:ubiquinone/menaquinone biosynthesis C-methylase UbiE
MATMPQALYDDIAEWYDQGVREGALRLVHGLILDNLLKLAGEVAGLRLCDLACGQGFVARALARRGAHVVGVDLSARLLALAERYEAEEPLGIAYLQDDAQALARLADASFDGVTCNLALMDIPDLTLALRATARILRPGGWLAFTITHPCFFPPDGCWIERTGEPPRREIGDYFAEGYARFEDAPGVRGKVGTHHRTLSTYLNGLVQSGLALERCLEPHATGAAADRLPRFRQLPIALAARCRKL